MADDMTRFSSAKLHNNKSKREKSQYFAVRYILVIIAVVFVASIHVFLFSAWHSASRTTGSKSSTRGGGGGGADTTSSKQNLAKVHAAGDPAGAGKEAAAAVARIKNELDGRAEGDAKKAATTSGASKGRRTFVFEISNLDGIEGSVDNITIEVERSWAPKGVDRFVELTEASFWEECRVFRVVPGFVVQFGINGDPATQKLWQKRTITDDPVKETNKRGTVTFATSGKNSRTTQMFINTGDNGRLDGMGFSPIGYVSSGMSVVDKIFSDYRERPMQGRIVNQGNTYLKKDFPKLSYFSKVYFDGDAASAQ